ncbi:MAG: lysylphosphatidylglycerol synthase transmembrane domain-containing protein [Desulfitobacterium hafniense]|nr:lysylphosphatidylglycerol synthase transmembrane domain-containing protein [Desulfitobacterium hafniense]
MSKIIKNKSNTLIILSILLLFFLLWTRKVELAEAWVVLKTGSWGFIAVAIFMEIFFFACQAQVYKELLKIWNANLTFPRAFAITLISSTVNKIFPSGGASGILVFIAEINRDGVKSEVGVLTNAVAYLLDYIAFLFVVLWGIYYLYLHSELSRTEEVALSIFTGIIAAAFIMFVLALKNSRLFIRLIKEKFNPRHQFLVRFKKSIIEGLGTSIFLTESWGRSRWRLLTAFIAAAGMQMADLLILYTAFKIIRYDVSPGLVAAGLALATVLSLVSMVPQGIGIYETSMTWFYLQLGVPFSIALSVALIYRAVTFWLPILPGLISLKISRRSAYGKNT